MRAKQFLKEYKKDTDNFTADDIKELEGIRDLETLKARAFQLVSTPSKRPMKPEKVAWFKQAIDSKTNNLAVIKLMWDLLLSGEGHAVVGSRSSMNPNSYRSRFNEGVGDNEEANVIVDEVVKLIGEGHTEVSPDVITTKVSAALGRPFMLKDLVAANNASPELQHYIASINPSKIKFSTDILTVKNEDPMKEKEAAQSGVANMAARAAGRDRSLAEHADDPNLEKRLSKTVPGYNKSMDRAQKYAKDAHKAQAKSKSIKEGVTSPKIKQAYQDIFKTEPQTPERKRAVEHYQSLRKAEMAKTKKGVKETDQGISKGAETKFHKKLDTLVHDTFGKRKEEMKENAEELNVGDEVKITGPVEFEGATGVIDSFGRDKRFVVVNLYNHGKHSFHSSDVSFNEYADSEEEDDDYFDPNNPTHFDYDDEDDLREDDYEDNYEDEEDEGFFVFIGDEEEGGFIGMVVKEDGKWRERTYKGTPPTNWGGTYMGYLTPQDVMNWIYKDYGRQYEDIRGPMSEDEANEYMDYMSEGRGDSKGLHKKVKIVKGPDAGKTGYVRQIKTDRIKNRVYLDLDLEDGGQSVVLKQDVRLVKEVDEGWESGPDERAPRERDPDYEYDTRRQEKLDIEAEKQQAKRPQEKVYTLVGRGPNMEPNYKFPGEYTSQEEAIAARERLMADPSTPNPRMIGISVHTRYLDESQANPVTDILKLAGLK